MASSEKLPKGIKIVPGQYTSENLTSNALVIKATAWASLSVQQIMAVANEHQATDDGLYALQLDPKDPTQLVTQQGLESLMRSQV